jgi:anti-sigma28 factor (negative regulator of flagellin synthesis)
MKVKDLSPAQVAPSSAQKVAAASTPAAQIQPLDRVSVPPTSTGGDQAAVLAARQSVSSGRAAQVQQIIQAVKSGQYYPSPQQIAQQLVSDAEVDAQIQAMLTHG